MLSIIKACTNFCWCKVSLLPISRSDYPYTPPPTPHLQEMLHEPELHVEDLVHIDVVLVDKKQPEFISKYNKVRCISFAIFISLIRPLTTNISELYCCHLLCQGGFVDQLSVHSFVKQKVSLRLLGRLAWKLPLPTQQLSSRNGYLIYYGRWKQRRDELYPSLPFSRPSEPLTCVWYKRAEDTAHCCRTFVE